MDPGFVDGLHALLVQSTANDTVQLKAATAQLNKEYYKNPFCIPALAQIIASAPQEAVRQLSAVELRKRIAQKSGDLWLQVQQSDREAIKVKLPEIALSDSSKLVRHAIARVISAIAAIEIPTKTWDSLLPFLHQTATSPVAANREVGSYILFTVLESIVEGFQEQLHSFFQLFEKLLQDPESVEVRVVTVRSLGIIAQYIDVEDKNDIRSFQALLPGMIQVVGQTLETGDEQNARYLFDVFETLLILEVPLLSKNIPELVQFFLQCGANRNLDEELRIMALNALNWTVKYKKTKIQSGNLGPAILEGLMPIATEQEPEDMDDDAPSRSALRIIDGLATSLPPTQIFPALRTLIQQYMSSPDPAQRRAAMLALGVSVEGCSEFMTPLMPHVWPIIDAGLQDQDPSVRKATCVAFGCLCEWLEADCAGRHAVLLPAIMALVNDQVTQRAACTALDAYLEILPDVIDQYLTLIMERLAGLLDTAPIPVKAVVTGAIGSAAHASKQNFQPYFTGIMDRVKHFLVLTGEGEETELRGITMDAVGTFGEALGADAFRPYFHDMMTQAFQGIELKSARLRECSFLFFGVMARVFGEEFAPYLPNVVPVLLASLRQNESGEDGPLLAGSDLDAFASGDSAATAINISDENSEEEEIDIDKLLDVNSAIAVEKEIAADTIGAIFTATKTHFLSYVEPSVIELVQLLNHYYEGIRKASSESLLQIVRTFYELSDPQEWQPGVNVVFPLHTNVKQLIGHVLPPLLEMYETEDDKPVVASLCSDIAQTINVVGPAFVEGKLDAVAAMAMAILEQKALCQQDPDQDDEDEAPEDQAEYDSVLISSAGDLVAALANALGNDFIQALQQFYPLIAKYYKKGRSTSDRSSAIGCLAEIISGMKGAITPFTEPLMELLYRAVADEEAEVQSNAAFAIGSLIENSDVELSGQYMNVLGSLQPLFAAPEDAPSAKLNSRDNAAGAVARMIVRNTAALPLEQVLPAFIGVLPLKADMLENRPVFAAIFHLFNTNPALLRPFLPKLLEVFAHVLDPSQPEQINDETRASLLQLVTVLNQEDPNAVAAAGLTAFVS